MRKVFSISLRREPFLVKRIQMGWSKKNVKRSMLHWMKGTRTRAFKVREFLPSNHLYFAKVNTEKHASDLAQDFKFKGFGTFGSARREMFKSVAPPSDDKPSQQEEMEYELWGQFVMALCDLELD